jgi:hypothetical protein
MLTQAQVQELFEYQDGNLLWQVDNPPNYMRSKVAGWVNKRGYIETKVNGRCVKVHRLIFLMHHGYLPTEVDHINGDKLDNRIENLRAATKSQNQQNRKVNKNSKSGVKGVSWQTSTTKWIVQISDGTSQKVWGRYVNLSDAKARADEVREKLHGEFCRHK